MVRLFYRFVAIAVFSTGEMLASPKSQEYVAGVMPKAKAAMFMGYYFVSMALGFLFAGILSGWAYDFFYNRLQNPPLMWVLFAGLAVLTAGGLLVFNRTSSPHFSPEFVTRAARIDIL